MVNDASDTAGESLAYKLERSTGSFFERIEKFWQKKWFRLLVAFLGLCVLGWFLVWLIFARDLPDAMALRTYEPPLPTVVRAYDGEPVHSYARERRVQLEFSEYPALLVRAYLAAEDRTFFEHGGLDYPGIATAILTNITRSGRPVGASTITQQVAKNLLLSSEMSYRRKVREAILAYRIEDVLTKEEFSSSTSTRYSSVAMPMACRLRPSYISGRM